MINEAVWIIGTLRVGGKKSRCIPSRKCDILISDKYVFRWNKIVKSQTGKVGYRFIRFHSPHTNLFKQGIIDIEISEQKLLVQ